MIISKAVIIDDNGNNGKKIVDNDSIINNFTNFIVVWCNGSTKDFGSFSTGSNPVTTTI